MDLLHSFFFLDVGGASCVTTTFSNSHKKKNRLAEVAFEAQDEAARLREQLDDIQKRQEVSEDRDSHESAGGQLAPSCAVGGGSSAIGGVGTSPRLDGRAALANGAPIAGTVLAGTAGKGGGYPGNRLVELELEKWECELRKKGAEKEAKEANLALGEAEKEGRKANLALENAEKEGREANLAREKAEKEGRETNLALNEARAEVSFAMWD